MIAENPSILSKPGLGISLYLMMLIAANIMNRNEINAEIVLGRLLLVFGP
jgi:hypothetical protein